MAMSRRHANPLSVDPDSLIAFAREVETAVRELDTIDWPKRKVFLDVVEYANGHGSAFATDLRTLATLLRKFG